MSVSMLQSSDGVLGVHSTDVGAAILQPVRVDNGDLVPDADVRPPAPATVAVGLEPRDRSADLEDDESCLESVVDLDDSSDEEAEGDEDELTDAEGSQGAASTTTVKKKKDSDNLSYVTDDDSDVAADSSEEEEEEFVVEKDGEKIPLSAAMTDDEDSSGSEAEWVPEKKERPRRAAAIAAAEKVMVQGALIDFDAHAAAKAMDALSKVAEVEEDETTVEPRAQFAAAVSKASKARKIGGPKAFKVPVSEKNWWRGVYKAAALPDDVTERLIQNQAEAARKKREEAAQRKRRAAEIAAAKLAKAQQRLEEAAAATVAEIMSKPDQPKAEAEPDAQKAEPVDVDVPVAAPPPAVRDPLCFCCPTS